ncbi:MAG: hypothetical protein AB7I50_02270 [Vicinamibacterales bacterium]
MRLLRSIVIFGFGVVMPVVAAAQAPVVLLPDEDQHGFLSRFTLVASVEALAEGDPRFRWDADIGVGVDVLDFGRGRVNVTFNYENVLGDELQPFDPRQGNYTIDTAGTWRIRATEAGVLFRHVSRHLGDRRKDFGIAWNDLGVRVSRTGRAPGWRWQVQGLAMKTVALGFVDYAGHLGIEAVVHREVSSRLSLLASGTVHRRFIERAVLGRGGETGARGELGIAVQGEAGAMEVVVGVEKRVDADAFELAPRDWAFAGLRFVMR